MVEDMKKVNVDKMLEDVGYKILPELEAEEAKQKLKEEMALDPVKRNRNFTSRKINWVDELKTWEECKIKSLELMGNESPSRNIFLAHNKDVIIGKPQLVHPTMKTIVLLKKVLKIQRDKNGDDSAYIINWKFLDDHYDKRYDGNLQYEWTQDFWIYRIVSGNKDYYIFSKEQLEMRNYKFTGMIVDLNDKTDMNNNLKLKSISRVFFLLDYEPTVKILSKNDIIELVKKINLTKENWFELINYHELKTINNFPEITNLLKSSFLLSGRLDGWPMHLAVMGRPGTRKSFGYIENMAYKFSEEPEIIEGANSRIKGLSPSFKEKPANIGYLARSERMGFIDELGKMVEFEINKHQSAISNVLGELNFLLDNKKRTVGSGNDNDCIVQAQAKFLFASNGVKGKNFLNEHIGLIDPTTMSRIFWWVQCEEETNLVLSNEGITRIPPSPRQAQDTLIINNKIKNEAQVGGLVLVWGEIDRDDFLTIFDTCNSFLCEIDDILIKELVKKIDLIVPTNMEGIWKPRAEHHIHLIVDGVCKTRCLFTDYSPEFKATKEDFEISEAILIKMIEGWGSRVSIKKELI